MNIKEQIKAYIYSQSEPKRSEMEILHKLILQVAPECRLWFEDGKNNENKTVSNPNIGYGFYPIHYTNGTIKEFYRIGLSANTVGISVYILGLKDKRFLMETYGKEIGKASISGYCIKFKTLKDIDIEVLKKAIQYRMEME